MTKKRRSVANDAAYELGMQENKAASTLQNLEHPVQRQCVEMSSRNFDCEYSRGRQALARGRTARSRSSFSYERKRLHTENISLAEANLREEINAGAMTHEEKRKDLEQKLRVSQSHLDRSESQVHKLTHEMKELQEVVKTTQKLEV